MTKITEALDQYMGICKVAISDSGAKLGKCFEKMKFLLRNQKKEIVFAFSLGFHYLCLRVLNNKLLLTMKHLKFFFALLVSLMTGANGIAWAAVDDTFTAANADGVSITYMVTSQSTVMIYGYWDETNDCAVPAVSSDYSGSLTIPSTVTYNGDGYTVTAIGEYSFCETGLTDVEIPASVETIGDAAFAGSNNLNTVTVNSQAPATLGDYTFMQISSNPILYVPKGYVSAYQNSEWSEYFKKIREVGDTSFGIGDTFTAANAEGVIITYMVTSSSTVMTFGDWDSINNRAVTAVPSNFSGSLTIPETATYQNVTYTVTAIGDYSFFMLSGLTDVEIPASVETIGETAFYSCSNLFSVTVNRQTPASLGYRTFAQIGSYAKLFVPEGYVSAYQDSEWSGYFKIIRVIGDTFTAANAEGVSITYLKTSSSTVMTFGDWDYVNERVVTAVPSDFSGSLTIPSTVTYNGVEYTVSAIGDQSFYGLTGLTHVEIPSSVETIGEMAFYNCRSLVSVKVNGQTPASLGNRAFINIGSEPTLYVPIGCSETYSISIWGNYFSICESFTAANVQGIPITYLRTGDSSVMTIASSPSDVKGALYIPETVTYEGHDFTVTNIGPASFINCTDLTSVTIPRTVTAIGSNAFKGCPKLSLTTIFSPTLTSIGYNAFYDCNSTYFTFYAEEAPGLGSIINLPHAKGIYCFVPAGSIDAYKAAVAAAYWGTNNVDRVSAIGDVGFIFSSLDENNVNIRYEVTSTSPAEVKVIYNSGAEYFGQGNQAMSIPETATFDNVTYSVTGIANFLGGNSVTSLFVPKSVTSIDDWAFAFCDVLESIIVDEDNPVFDSPNDCNAIIRDNTLVVGCRNTVIPNDVTAIGINAFGNCNGLSSITIPSSVTSIGEYAFGYCQNLIDVICCAETPPTLDQDAFEGLSSSAKLYVPDDDLNSYKSSAWTSYFNVANILPITQYKPFVAEVGNTFTRLTEEGEEVTYQIMSLDEVNHTGTVRLYGWYDGMYEDDGYIKYKYGNCINKVNIYNKLTIPSTVTFGSGDDMFTYTVTEVGDYAFLFLGYSTCILPSGSNQTFTDCKYIYLPSTITRIGKYAFSAMGGASSDVIYAYLPEGVEEIDDFAFQRALFLKQLSLPKSLKRIGCSAFEECEELETVRVYNPIPIQPTVWHQYEIDPQPRYPFPHKFHSGRTLYVPYGSKYKYLNSGYWGFGKDNFGSYLEGFYFEFVQMMNNKEDDVTTIEPEDDYSTDFAMEMVDGDNVLDLQDAVAGGVYYNLKSDYENGFDGDEGCIVINNNSDMSGVSGDFNRALLVDKDYSGLVVEVQGKGIVMIDCQTLGSGKLTVRIGDGTPVAYEQNAQGAISINFDVSSPTPIYIYVSGIGSQSANAYVNAPRRVGSASDNCVKIYSLNVVPNIEFSISNVGMGTFACNSALDFTNLEDVVKVYYATYDDESTELTFHQIRKVPPHTGVLLVSAHGGAVSNQHVPALLDRQYDSVEGNVFVQGTGETVSYSEENHIYDYILYNGDSGLGFYKANKNLVATNRAYIHIPYHNNDIPVAPTANYYAINLEEVDAITTMKDVQSRMANGQIYNLAGQRLNKFQHGLNIVNGKKVLVK